MMSYILSAAYDRESQRVGVGLATTSTELSVYAVSIFGDSTGSGAFFACEILLAWEVQSGTVSSLPPGRLSIHGVETGAPETQPRGL